ncbi:hypothetical protein C8R43DRAFT_1198026 [Mycena crocata]|nr:hypothetical protein C8R43DRAFT_1198026 [Mycena crocata]
MPRGRGRLPRRRRRQPDANDSAQPSALVAPLASISAVSDTDDLHEDLSTGIPLTGEAARYALLVAQAAGRTPVIAMSSTANRRLFLNPVPHTPDSHWALLASIPVENLAAWFDDQNNDFNPYEMVPPQDDPASLAVLVHWIGHPGDSPRDPRAHQCFIRWNDPRPPEIEIQRAISRKAPVLRWVLYCAGIHNMDFTEEVEDPEAESGDDELSNQPAPVDDLPMAKIQRWKECDDRVKLHCEVYPDDLSKVFIWQQNTHNDVPLEDRKHLKFSRQQRTLFLEKSNRTQFSTFGRNTPLPEFRKAIPTQLQSLYVSIKHRALLDRNPWRATHLLRQQNAEKIFTGLGFRSPSRASSPMDGQSERSEYKLIYDVHQSMQAVNKHCLKDGVRFPTYTGGMIPSPPSSDDSCLLTMSLGDWTSMSELERVKLWATGLDLYIFGMDSGPKTENIREAVTRLHRLDAPVEVQLQALRISSDDENANIDYTSSIRTTTLRNVLDNAERVDGLVLNVLKLPSGHMVRKNPLLDSGLDLDTVAYRMTNGLTGFAYNDPPYNEMYWELIGLAHSFSPCHFDVAASRVFVAGPGEKFWIRSRTRALEARLADGVDPRKDDITDSVAFDGWDPTIASTESCEYEGCVLPAGEGVLLMQPGRKHLVVGTDTGENARGPSRTATLTTGGHFFCASSIRPSMCIILHMVMLQHILTNAEYVGMWPVMIRICAFWLDVTLNRPTGDLIPLAAYIPDLELPHAEGWLDIIYLSSIIVLLPALDVRTYNESPHVDIPTERDYTVDSYQNWRKSLAKRFVCFKSGKKVHWEKDIFTPVLLHLAVTMAQYHRRQSIRFPDAEAYQYFTTEKLEQNIQHVLKGYDAKLPARFQKQVHGKQESTRLFLLDDAQLEIFRI